MQPTPTRIAFLKRLSLALALAGATLLGVLAYNHKNTGVLPASRQAETPIAGLGGPFSLTSHRNARVSEKTFLGKPTLYFFGFTHCPDICPTTLYQLSQHMQELGKEADRLNAAFITVDPSRDTANVLAEYMQAFDPRIAALTGTQAEIDAMVKAYKVYAKKIPLEQGAYTMDHTATVFGADAQGRVVMLIDFHEAPEMVRGKIRRLLEMK